MPSDCRKCATSVTSPVPASTRGLAGGDAVHSTRLGLRQRRSRADFLIRRDGRQPRSASSCPPYVSRRRPDSGAVPQKDPRADRPRVRHRALRVRRLTLPFQPLAGAGSLRREPCRQPSSDRAVPAATAIAPRCASARPAASDWKLAALRAATSSAAERVSAMPVARRSPAPPRRRPRSGVRSQRRRKRPSTLLPALVTRARTRRSTSRSESSLPEAPSKASASRSRFSSPT